MRAVFPDFIEPNLCDVRAYLTKKGLMVHLIKKGGLAKTSLVAILAEDPQPFNRAHKYLSPAHISIEVVFHPEEVAIFPYLFIH